VARELQLKGGTGIVLALQAVQLISALVLNEALLGAAYAVSDGDVETGDELHLLGPSGPVGLAMIGLITLLSILSTAGMLWNEELHERAWIAPVVGIVAGAAACVIAIAGFQPLH